MILREKTKHIHNKLEKKKKEINNIRETKASNVILIWSFLFGQSCPQKKKNEERKKKEVYVSKSKCDVGASAKYCNYCSYKQIIFQF